MSAPDFIIRARAAIAQITDPQLSTSAVDVTNCDREPIHIPAAIQPHGVLLALSATDWTIVQVSQNTDNYLGQSPEALLNQPLSTLLSESQIQLIGRCLAAEFETVNPLRFEISVNERIQIFSGVVHRSGETVILELEPSASHTAVNFFDFYTLVKRPVSRLQQTQSLSELCQVAVEEVRRITEFDRVMVYRFDSDGAGNVIAETKQAEMSPYLGLRYPATDIPKQAQYLYTLNWLRLIPNSAYQPIPIVPTENPVSGEPLDMSLSTLRSVSPIHIEYLSNMGVKASLSISLVRDRRLWGLIACHHNSPRQLSYELRTICEFLGQVFSLELAAKEDSEDADYKFNLKAIQVSFVDSLRRSQLLQAGLTQDPEKLLALTGSTGAAFYEKGAITLVGKTPQLSEVRHLAQWIETRFHHDVIYHTDALSAQYPAAAHFQHLASGLLALAISQTQQLYVLWFRPEVVQTVNWAGDPNKSVDIDAEGSVRISPRQSFELWKETVRQQSLPWKPCEIEAALELRSAIIGLVLQKADELAQVNLELERSNTELDAFAYFASHDLKEPLRGIHNYSSFLIEDYGEQLDEDGVSKLQTLMRLTQRMEDLINSLLHYSRLGRIELSIHPVDLSALVDGVIEVVKMSKPEQVDFRIPRLLPTVACDRSQISELFTNLISNGVKYNDKAEKWVEIGYLEPHEAASKNDWSMPIEQPLDKTIFYVQDNGIGIRSKHLDAIFRIFKRLHPPGRFGGGTGAGLTIAKKIAERHGGQIWLESIYGEGSIFYFTLES